MGNPLTLAAYLTPAMGAATALWMGAATRLGRLAWLVALALMGACWIYTEARGALLGASLALPLILLAVRSKTGKVRPLTVPIAVLVAAMVVAVAVSGALGFSTLSVRASFVLLTYLALVGVFAWLLERGRTGLALLLPLVVLAAGGIIVFIANYSGNITLADLGLSRTNARAPEVGDVSLKTRLYVWRDIVPMVLDRSLLGHGPDNFREPFRPYISQHLETLIVDGRGELRGLDRAHSHLLQVAATTGFLGLAAYVWVLVSFFLNAYRHTGGILAALSGAVLAYVIQLQTAFPSVATDVAFWGILGASVALMRLADREDSEPPEGTNIVGSRRSRQRSKSAGRAELLVAVAVVGLLAVIAVPTFLQQQKKIAESERARLNIELLLAVARYESFLRVSGNGPEAGVYTAANPESYKRAKWPPHCYTIRQPYDHGRGHAGGRIYNGGKKRVSRVLSSTPTIAPPAPTPLFRSLRRNAQGHRHAATMLRVAKPPQLCSALLTRPSNPRDGPTPRM